MRGSFGRIAVAGLVALVIGATTAVITGRIFEQQLVGAWGAVYGTLAFFATFGLTLAILGRRRQRRLGALLLCVAAALLSLGAWWFVSWGTDLFSLEGAWLWPLAIAATVVAVGAFARALRSDPPAGGGVPDGVETSGAEGEVPGRG